MIRGFGNIMPKSLLLLNTKGGSVKNISKIKMFRLYIAIALPIISGVEYCTILINKKL